MTRVKEALITIIEEVVDGLDWMETKNYAQALTKIDSATAKFVDDYELGDWFYYQLQIENVDIEFELLKISKEKRKNQAEEEKIDKEIFIIAGIGW